jgi:hypothetical protein
MSMKLVRYLLALCLLVFVTAGCTLGRVNVDALSNDQDKYYSNLEALLKAHRIVLAAGLDTQKTANAERRFNLLQWQRDQTRTEILLSVANLTSDKGPLLLLKLAELDVADSKSSSASADLDQAKIDAILKAYDAIISSVQSAKKNNKAVLGYLGSGDAKFALQSFDIDAMVRADSLRRDAQAILNGVQQRTDAVRAADEQQTRDKLARARDALIKAFGKQ